MKKSFYKMVSHMNGVLILGALIYFSACQKVIDLDLNSVSPEIVIEGSVSDQPGPYFVQISKSIDYNQTNKFPAVQGAVVTLSDNAGNTEILAESSPGKYQTNTFTGITGRFFFLKVEVQGKEYQAQSSMSPSVKIDTITIDSMSFGSTSNKFVNVKFTDPVGVKNFYRVIEIINSDTLNTINITNDEFEDGQQITASVFSDQKPKLKSKDNVVILLQCIDESVYNYLNQLSQVINGGGQSTAPANPTSNINNNALGYFSAYSVRSQTVVVP